jgi:ORF6N domain
MTELQQSAPAHSVIGSQTHLLRDQRVMIDSDLAELYGTQTKVLVQAVKRNLARFPSDFMFQLTADEFSILRSQSVTSSWGGRRIPPYAFTEQGVAMISSVLGSPRAIAVNIEIMRTFIKIRQLAATHRDLAKRLDEIDEQMQKLAVNHDSFSRNTRAQFKQVFDALRELATSPEAPAPPKRPIGFIQHDGKK